MRWLVMAILTRINVGCFSTLLQIHCMGLPSCCSTEQGFPFAIFRGEIRSCGCSIHGSEFFLENFSATPSIMTGLKSMMQGSVTFAIWKSSFCTAKRNVYIPFCYLEIPVLLCKQECAHSFLQYRTGISQCSFSWVYTGWPISWWTWVGLTWILPAPTSAQFC